MLCVIYKPPCSPHAAPMQQPHLLRTLGNEISCSCICQLLCNVFECFESDWLIQSAFIGLSLHVRAETNGGNISATLQLNNVNGVAMGKLFHMRFSSLIILCKYLAEFSEFVLTVQEVCRFGFSYLLPGTQRVSLDAYRCLTEYIRYI